MNIIKKKRIFINSLFKWTIFLLLQQIVISKKLKAKSKPKILIIGGGFGGMSCLKYFSNFKDLVDLTLVDKSDQIQTCPFSNLVIGGLLDYSQITFNLKLDSFVKFYKNQVKKIHPHKKKVEFIDGSILEYDFLILSPGIGFKNQQINGYSLQDKTNIPHCWDGTKNIKKFKSYLNSLENKSVIIISSPDYPYRCPPAPYERASMIANFLKKRKKKFKILIFDAKNSFTKKDIFFSEWKENYGDSVEWIKRDKGGILTNYETKFVYNNQGQKIKGDFIHIIPEQKAANIIFDSNLSYSDWCKINPTTFELNDFKDIYVLGDSVDAGDMPKSAFSAESQSKVLSINLINRIMQKSYIDPVFLNTCYSFSAPNRAFSISSWYKLNKTKDSIVSLGSSESKLKASSLERQRESIEAFGWYESITKKLYI
tara:strand:+ start:2350 stop:3627 length:1278 start_codon:yes stop_codon:yes gene_type:complete